MILLDVVMEQPDAGLHLVRYIRETLGMFDVRIILRTGQPGYTPEIEAIRDLDINDYRTKSELTRTKLYTTVAAAVRSYQQLHALVVGRAGLERIVHAGTELMRLHGARDVARSILQQAAALLGQTAAGVLCAREGERLARARRRRRRAAPGRTAAGPAAGRAAAWRRRARAGRAPARIQPDLHGALLSRQVGTRFRLRDPAPACGRAKAACACCTSSPASFRWAWTMSNWSGA